MNPKKRNRCATFSADEKILIASICARKKHILENKKTDRSSSVEKCRAWDEIAAEVNSAAPNGVYRSPGEIKRFYENKKREVRKIVAQEKSSLIRTGGGPAANFKKNACHDIILSIMNTKTVNGLPNSFDGDAESEPSNSGLATVSLVPTNPTVTTFGSEEAAENVDVDSTQRGRPPLCSSRHRPTANIVRLTSSELGKKYDVLLNKRLELTEMQKKEIEIRIQNTNEEHKLKKELLQIQIQTQKEQLEVLRRAQ